MNIFTDQIELAFKEAKNTIIMGDANLCANKWKDENFTHKNMSNLLRGTLESCGMKIGQVGPTFMADHCQRNGMIAESWLDHIYYTKQLESVINIKNLNNHSSDHRPVVACLKTKLSRKIYKRKIIKRKMKNFTNEGWNEALSNQDWTRINTFYNDAANLWNAAPKTIKECNTVCTVKKQIKLHVKTLPL